MKLRVASFAAFLFLFLFLMCNSLAIGQQPAAVSNSTSGTAVVPPLVSFSGALTDSNGKALSGVVGVTFALYKEAQGGPPLWLETQNVYPDKTGHYTVLLGSTTSTGLPADLFVAGEARWLGVQSQGQAEQPRVSLLSVPYALKAADAQTVGGLPASAFVLAAPPVSGVSSAASASAVQPLATGTTPVTTAGGTVNKLAKFDAAADITSSQIYDTGTNVGIGNTTPATRLDVSGSVTVRGTLALPATGVATASGGKNSQPLLATASVFNSGTAAAVNQKFQWQAEPVGNNTATVSGAFNLLYGAGTGALAETGLKINNKGVFTFAAGQTFPGTGTGNGTITGVTAGTDLTGGGTSGIVTVNVDITKVPQLNTANTFTGNQTVNGNVSATGLVTGTGFNIGSDLFASGSLANANVFLGFAGNTTMTSYGNTASGAGALSSQTTGGNNTANGVLALYYNTTGSLDTAVGGWALYNNTTGINNTAIGAQALQSNTTANDNTATGATALGNNTTGFQNTADGSAALADNTTGGNNTAIGQATLVTNTTGFENTALGVAVLIQNTTGNYNTGSGGNVLFSNTTGTWNTAAGDMSLYGNTTGSNNTASGYQALQNNTTGNYNTALGSGAGPDKTTPSLTNATAIGAYADVTENNALVLGSINGVNGAISSTNVGIGTTAPKYTLDVQGTGNFTGLVNFASGQTFPGSGTITGVTAGTDLTGGGTSGNVTLNLDTTKVPQLSAANTFSGNQTVKGAVTATSFAGSGSGLTNLQGANVQGAVASAVGANTAATANNALALGGQPPSAYALAAALPSIVAQVALPGESGDVPQTTLLTPTKSGLYRASVNILGVAGNCTPPATLVLSWTDDGGQRTISSTSGAVASGGIMSWTVIARVNAGSPMSYSTNITPTCVTYDLYMTVEQLQ